MRLTTALNMTSTPVLYSRSGAVPFSPALLFAGGQQGLLLEPEVFSPASLFAGDQEGLLFEPER